MLGAARCELHPSEFGYRGLGAPRTASSDDALTATRKRDTLCHFANDGGHRAAEELFGRGPTKARTNYAGPDTLVSTIENSLVPSERNMLELGEHQRVREIRMFFQHASDREFTQTVEEITGRKVLELQEVTNAMVRLC